MQMTLVQCSLKFMGEKLWKSHVFFEWHKWFKEGCDSVEDDEKSGCLRSHRTDEIVEKMLNLVHSDRHSSIRAMAVQLI